MIVFVFVSQVKFFIRRRICLLQNIIYPRACQMQVLFARNVEENIIQNFGIKITEIFVFVRSHWCRIKCNVYMASRLSANHIFVISFQNFIINRSRSDVKLFSVKINANRKWRRNFSSDFLIQIIAQSVNNWSNGATEKSNKCNSIRITLFHVG